MPRSPEAEGAGGPRGATRAGTSVPGAPRLNIPALERGTCIVADHIKTTPNARRSIIAVCRLSPEFIPLLVRSQA
jgi:hypothetical protein